MGIETLRQLMIKEKLWKPRLKKQSKKNTFSELKKTISERWFNLMEVIIFGLEILKLVYFCLLMTLQEKSLTLNLTTTKEWCPCLVSGQNILTKMEFQPLFILINLAHIRLIIRILHSQGRVEEYSNLLPTIKKMGVYYIE